MKKLSLCLDELQVQSFHVAPAAAGRGTVAAHLGGTAVCGDSDAFTCTCELSQLECEPDLQRRIIVYSDGASCTCPPPPQG
ncbi:MAG TPA: hypothetical protein VFQ39_00710 [Longimicrobium sp.]|nr:hypothetical protein [Longimicrobium sp.]